MLLKRAVNTVKKPIKAFSNVKHNMLSLVLNGHRNTCNFPYPGFYEILGIGEKTKGDK